MVVAPSRAAAAVEWQGVRAGRSAVFPAVVAVVSPAAVAAVFLAAVAAVFPAAVAVALQES